MIPTPGFVLSDRQETLLKSGIMLFCALSLISSLIIVFSHWYFIELRKHALKFVVLMSLCLAGSDLTALLYVNGGNCNTYSFLTTFFVIASALWSMVLSRTMALVLNRDALSSRLVRLNSVAAHFQNYACLRWLSHNVESVRMFAFHSAVWGVSIVCSLAMTIQADTQPSISNWCWFQQTHDDDSNEKDNVDSVPDPVQFWLFFTPITVAFLYNCKTLFWASCKQTCNTLFSDRWRDVALIGHETNEDDLQQQLDTLTRSLRYYIFLSIMVCAWLCTSEIINIFDNSNAKNIVWTYTVLLVFLRLHGFGNLIIYIMREDVRRLWREEWYFLTGKVDPQLKQSLDLEGSRVTAYSTGNGASEVLILNKSNRGGGGAREAERGKSNAVINSDTVGLLDETREDQKYTVKHSYSHNQNQQSREVDTKVQEHGGEISNSNADYHRFVDDAEDPQRQNDHVSSAAGGGSGGRRSGNVDTCIDSGDSRVSGVSGGVSDLRGSSLALSMDRSLRDSSMDSESSLGTPRGSVATLRMSQDEEEQNSQRTASIVSWGSAEDNTGLNSHSNLLGLGGSVGGDGGYGVGLGLGAQPYNPPAPPYYATSPVAVGPSLGTTKSSAVDTSLGLGTSGKEVGSSSAARTRTGTTK